MISIIAFKIKKYQKWPQKTLTGAPVVFVNMLSSDAFLA